MGSATRSGKTRNGAALTWSTRGCSASARYSLSCSRVPRSSPWTGHPHRATRDLDLLGFGEAGEEHIRSVFVDIARTTVPDWDGRVRAHGERRAARDGADDRGSWGRRYDASTAGEGSGPARRRRGDRRASLWRGARSQDSTACDECATFSGDARPGAGPEASPRAEAGTLARQATRAPSPVVTISDSASGTSPAAHRIGTGTPPGRRTGCGSRQYRGYRSPRCIAGWPRGTRC